MGRPARGPAAEACRAVGEGLCRAVGEGVAEVCAGVIGVPVAALRGNLVEF